MSVNYKSYDSPEVNRILFYIKHYKTLFISVAYKLEFF